MLADAGLFIVAMREYPYSNGCQLFGGMAPLPGRRFAMPPGTASVPLMLSVVVVHREHASTGARGARPGARAGAGRPPRGGPPALRPKVPRARKGACSERGRRRFGL